jgi:hypothetical protein
VAQQPQLGRGLLIIQTLQAHSDTPHLVGLLWTSDQSDAETSTWQQHTALTKDTHSFPRRYSNPQSQRATTHSRRRPPGHWDGRTRYIVTIILFNLFACIPCRINTSLVNKIPGVPCESLLMSLVHYVVTASVFCWVVLVFCCPTTIPFHACQLQSFPDWLLFCDKRTYVLGKYISSFRLGSVSSRNVFFINCVFCFALCVPLSMFLV